MIFLHTESVNEIKSQIDKKLLKNRNKCFTTIDKKTL